MSDVQQAQLVLGADLDEPVGGRPGAGHREVAQAHPLGQTEADGHRADVAPPMEAGVPRATISWPKSTATRSASASTSSM